MDMPQIGGSNPNLVGPYPTNVPLGTPTIWGPQVSATYYVATSGMDGNDGTSWETAFATLQAAINALPANGGVIEVGYGTFIDPRGYIAVDTTVTSGSIHIRGRGIGRATEEGQASEVHPTTIASTLILRAAITTGTPNTPENLWAGAVLVEDCAFVVPAGQGWSTKGVGMLLSTPWAHFRRCAFDSCGSHGVMTAGLIKFAIPPATGAITATLDYPFFTTSFSGSAIWYIITSTGQVIPGSTLTSGSSTVTFGSAITGSPGQYAMVYTGSSNVTNNTEQWFATFEKCLFVNNGGCAVMGGWQVTGFYNCHAENNGGAGSGTSSAPFTGAAAAYTAAFDSITLSASQDTSFYSCIIQRQKAGCGAISFAGIALNCTGCHIENNPNTVQASVNLASGVSTFTSCFLIPPASGTPYMIYIAAASAVVRLVGCYAQGINGLSQGFINGSVGGYVFAGSTFGNRLSGSIQGACDGLANDGTGPILADNGVFGGINSAAAAYGIWSSNLILGEYQQALTANGAVTIDASKSSNQTVVLAANATSSSITNPSHGQILVLSFEQDNTGIRTFVPPTNIKWANNTAPTWSTTANTVDIITLKGFYTGTNYYWREIARSIGVPAPAT